MAGVFSQNTLEQIRASNDIVEVISAYLPLKRRGANFVALCPFHKEKTPSFHVHPQRQIFHCFGCHKGGDVFTFVQLYENVSFPEAVRRLAERVGIRLALEEDTEGAARRDLKRRLLDLMEQITRRWQNVLATEAAGRAARDYLARRGVSAEAIQKFRLGAAPAAWDDTVNWARSRGFDPELVEQAGLIIRREDGSGYYDRFRGRLIFPICDEQGRVIAFSGRVLGSEAETAKYINSPETPLFRKSRVFYGLDKSRRAILDAGFAVICEGQLDLIACHEAGVTNVVAPLGTAFTEEHARLLRRYTSEAVLCFDSDEAGQQAMSRALEALLEAGLVVRVAVVPSPDDPDSFIRTRGPEAFQALIRNAGDFFDYYLKRLCQKHDVQTDSGRLAILREMGRLLLKTANALLIENHARKTAAVLGVSPEAVLTEFRRMDRQGGSPRPQSEPTPGQAAPAGPPPLEEWLLRLLLQHDSLLPWLVKHLSPEWLQHDGVRRIVQMSFQWGREGRPLRVADLVQALPEPELQSLISACAVDDRPLPEPERQVRDVTLRIRNAWLDRRLDEYRRRMGRPDLSDADRLALLQEMQNLRHQKLADLPLPDEPAP
ncbi:DNA primase [Limisphaera sp. 4302-co]|uniref:DNA primase n=1 Tax=Limisphaera sp. 4302-co TaxID=3400417 RepID=UPI003C22BEE8